MKIRRWRTTKLENQDLDNIEEKKKILNQIFEHEGQNSLLQTIDSARSFKK